ncbi:hypothetical protein GW590_08295 [Rahnella sp. SAP-1]|uniref:Big-1 domain-containing protein n=1 Tax=Rouxiella aceris TaxID=2703884 RepID=A0A848MIS8_9GAMM|nr:Ig-like domain-containing protein [Rouxiella aceris]NMP26862.1 hypothetical protein [Rouxiella aceris]
MSIIALQLASYAVLADGVTTNRLQVNVTGDVTGNPESGLLVTLSADAALSFSETHLTTDESGAATATFTSTQPGTYPVTATLADGTTVTGAVAFLAVPDAANIEPTAQVPTQAATNVLTSGVKDLVGSLRAGIEDLEKVIDTVSAVGLLPVEELEALGKKLFAGLLQKFQ